MKRNVIYLLFTLFILTSCHTNNHGEERTRLKQAELLVQLKPDSTLHFLQQFKHPHTLPKELYANYCLLWTQAYDNTFTPIHSDSLILEAVNYYQYGNDSLKKAQSYFYYGRVCHQLKETEKATQSYLKALSSASETGDYGLLGLIYNNLGNLHSEQRMYTEGLKYNREAVRYAQLSGDQLNVIYTTRDVGRTYTYLNDPDSALFYYCEALRVARQIKHNACISSILAELAQLYDLLGSYDKGIAVAVESLAYTEKKNILQRYFIIGKIYLHQSNYESALFYLQKSSQSDNIYTQGNSYGSLYELEKQHGDYKQALAYNECYLQIIDSIDKITRREAIANLQMKYQNERTKSEQQISKLMQKKEYLYRSLFFSVCLSLLVLSLSVYISMQSMKKQNALLHDIHVQVEEKEAYYRNSKEEIQQKEYVIYQLTTRERFLLDKFFTHSDIIRKVRSFNEMGPEEKKQASLSEAEWTALVQKFEECFDWISKLKSFYPTLSSDDIRLFCLLRLEIHSDVICALWNTNPEALSKRKQRIKKDKLELFEDKTPLEILISKLD